MCMHAVVVNPRAYYQHRQPGGGETQRELINVYRDVPRDQSETACNTDTNIATEIPGGTTNIVQNQQQQRHDYFL